MAITLKLLIDRNSRKVLFAEARKDFVDFLFGLLGVPLGSLVRLLFANGFIGFRPVNVIYESVKHLDSSYLQENVHKDLLLNPAMPASSSVTGTPPLLENFAPIKSTTSCTGKYSRLVEDISGEANGKEVGYVKESAVFMVMDDLRVRPMPSSQISCIILIGSLEVRDLSSLEEKIVEVDFKKVLELVLVSFDSITVLTDVFLGNKIVG